MEPKEINGMFFRATRELHGLYALQVVTIKNGKVIDVEHIEANYPPVMKDKLVKFAFNQAIKEHDEASQ